MQPNRIIQAALFSICFLATAAACFAQASTQVIYTGKLVGYFRSPSHQAGDNVRGCSASSSNSEAAVKFQELRDKYQAALLVGTGDNFAPQLEGRVFDPFPARSAQSALPADAYPPGNKELYYWYQDKNRWIYYQDLDQYPEFKTQLALGRGTIPTDNVGCFLAAARFAAIVPGKHDFYFGAERVHELARFMASLPDKNPPQMLGANLVIKTSKVETPSRITQKPKSKWPEGSSIKNLGDGKSVYPWFSSPVNVKIPSPESKAIKDNLEQWFADNKAPSFDKVEGFLKNRVMGSTGDENEDWKKLLKALTGLPSIKVCLTNEFNEVAATCTDGWKVELKEINGTADGISYSISIPANPAKPWSKDKKIPVFEPGRNYGLCQVNKESAEDGVETKCQTFSVYHPFLSFPRVPSLIGTNYTDPDPFVIIRNAADPKREVAIFGVVDPGITQQIGVLNYSWLNDDLNLKTVVSAEDPAEALREQLDYFESWYSATNQRKFEGLRILLAQMSPQHARVLAARLKGFQMVVTEADQEQATSEAALSTEWTKDTPAGAFIAVPSPYYQTGLKEDVEGVVHFGMIEAQRDGVAWTLQSKVSAPVEVHARFMPKERLADILAPSLNGCVPAKFLDFKSKPATLNDIIKWATLCAMRDRLHADVALIQKRDFFDRVPADANPTNVQQILDRLVWKGDLLTLMYVPGSALKKALDLSKKYDNDDSDTLSLAGEKRRGLEYVGIVKPEKDYLINESPLDDKKIYAVATTDYIAAGDTGYPDLAANALDPRTRPSQYPETLESISALVCRRLYPVSPGSHCLAAAQRDKYLDEISVSAPPSPRQPGFGSKVRDAFPFKLPGKDDAPKSIGGALDREVQQRGIWMLSLKKFSVQFSGLKNNDTDANIDQKFGGISTSGVNTHKNHQITVGLDTRLVRSTHRYDLFGAVGIDYNEKSTGVANTTSNVVQVTNRLTGDLGVLWNLWGGRSVTRWGPVFTLHGETQLATPFTMFTLGTSTPDANGNNIDDRLTIHQNRSRLLLARAGLRSQNRTNAFEFGFEGGRELNALKGYQFITNGTLTETCKADAQATFAKCIKDHSKGTSATITKNSVPKPLLVNRPRAGFYWKWNISIPFNDKVKYELTDEGDLFLANIAQDIVTDTRFRDLSVHSLKFTVFPSFSIGPSLRLLLYQNQASRDGNGNPIKNNFLSQKTFGLEASFSFDWFNRREAGVQIRHKP